MKRLLLFVLVVNTTFLQAQTTVQFSSTSDNAWLTGSNWSGGSVPGPTAIAVFNSWPAGSGSNAGSNIAFSSGTNNGLYSQAVGAIRIAATRFTGDMIVGNSSPNIDGILKLNGVTISGTSNVVVDNQMLTNKFNLDNSIVGNNRIMKVDIGSNAVFRGGLTSVTEITAQVSTATNVTVKGGTLKLGRSGGATFPSTTNFNVETGVLRVSTNQTINNLDLTFGSTLIVDDGATLTINGVFYHRGATIIESGSGKIIYTTGGTLEYNNTSSFSISLLEWPLINGPKNVIINSSLTLPSTRSITGTITVNGTLNTGNFQMAAANVVVNSGAVVKTSSSSTAGALNGAFGSAAITLNAGSTVELNGNGLQYLSPVSYSHLTINNGGNGVALAGDATVNGTLSLNNSTRLDLAGKKLTLGGSVSGTIIYRGSSTSGLKLASASPLGVLNFDQTADGATNALGTLSISSGSASLGNKINIYTGLDVAGGTLDLAAKNVVLKSTASNTAYVAEIKGTLSGETNISVERYTPAWSTRRYRLLTSPLMNTTINAAWQEGSRWNGTANTSSNGFGTLITGQAPGSVTAANNSGFDYWSAVAGSSASIRSYSAGTTNAQASWKAVTSTLTPNAFDENQAYLLFVRGDRGVSTGNTAGITVLRGNGKLKKGTITISVPHNRTHTLIGNPYASPIDFKKIYDDNSSKIQPWFWIWQASLGTGTGGYVLVRPVSTGSSLYETVPGNGSQLTSNRLIHSGEGLFVMPAAGATSGNTISIKESHKAITTPSVSVFKTADADPAKLYINLYTNADNSKTLVDGVLAEFNEYSIESTDVAKSANSGENISIQKNSSDLIFASNSMPSIGDTLKLRFWNTAVRDYDLEINAANFDNLGVAAYLIDNYKKTETPLRMNNQVNSYAVSVNADAASKEPYRFSIVFKMGTTLPLHITGFKAILRDNKNVQLEWQVANESGIKTYSLERSADAVSFMQLTNIPARAAVGNQTYQHVDTQPAAINYYRVKMTGDAGEVKYSSVVKVELNWQGESVSLYPNPVDGKTINLQLNNKPKGVYTVTLYNMAGQPVQTKNILHKGGNLTESISLTDNVLKGNYELEVKTETGEREMIPVSVLR